MIYNSHKNSYKGDKMDKEIIFIPSEKSKEYKLYKNEVIHGYDEVQEALKKGVSIRTTQMSLLSTRLIVDYGYKVFIVGKTDKLIEINLGNNTSTERYIREGHHLFNLWAGGEFE